VHFSDVIWFENKFFAASYNGNVHEFDPFPKTKLPNTDEIGKFWPKAYSSTSILLLILKRYPFMIQKKVFSLRIFR